MGGGEVADAGDDGAAAADAAVRAALGSVRCDDPADVAAACADASGSTVTSSSACRSGGRAAGLTAGQVDDALARLGKHVHRTQIGWESREVGGLVDFAVACCPGPGGVRTRWTSDLPLAEQAGQLIVAGCRVSGRTISEWPGYPLITKRDMPYRLVAFTEHEPDTATVGFEDLWPPSAASSKSPTTTRSAWCTCWRSASGSLRRIGRSGSCNQGHIGSGFEASNRSTQRPLLCRHLVAGTSWRNNVDTGSSPIPMIDRSGTGLTGLCRHR